METHQRANIVHRILSHYTICTVDGTQYLVQEPSQSVLYQSYEFYNTIIDKHKYDDCLTKHRALLLLVSNGLWTLGGDKNFDTINESIDNLKLQLYNTIFGDNKKHQKLRKQLEMTKKKQNEMYARRYQLDTYTLEGLAEHMRNYFIYVRTICDSNHDLLWQNPKDCDSYLLEHIAHSYMLQTVTEKQYRELARTTPWVSYWTAYKNTITPHVGGELLDHIISYSKFYDNIHKNPECPTDDIINDDDILDGWIISQRKESEQQQKEKTMSTIGKRGAGEIGIPAKTQEDANKIFAQNTLEARAKHRLRTEHIQRQGEISEMDMPDTKRDISMQAQRQASEAIKQKGKQ